MLAGVAGLLLAVGYFTWAHMIAERALAQAQITALSQRVTSLRADSGRLEIRYKTDTIRLRQQFTHTDTLRDTLLLHLTDTVLVKEFIAAEVAEKKSCSETIATCEQRAENAEKRAAVIDSMYRAQQKLTPSLWKRSGSVVLHWGEAAIACHFLKC